MPVTARLQRRIGVPNFDLPVAGMARSTQENAAAAFEPELEQRLRYRLMLWLCVPVQWGVALFGLYVLSHEPLTGSAMTGLILSLSVSVGIGVVVAHELCHHAQKFDRFMGVLLFAPTNMADFRLYHNIGHHNLVATLDDPA